MSSSRIRVAVSLLALVAGCSSEPPPAAVSVPPPSTVTATPSPPSTSSPDPIASAAPPAPSASSASASSSGGAAEPEPRGTSPGSGSGGVPGARNTVPSLRQGSIQVNGRLPPEVISRIVRQNFGRFRVCYEKLLRQDPGAKGEVRTAFVIDRSGSVTSVKDGGSTMTDETMRECVRKAISALAFPQPEGGVVAVVYPIGFAPPSP